jgi:hypothetical protein
MEKVKESQVILSKNKILIFLVSLIIIITVPAFIHNQFITGPLVNALLIITCAAVGPMEAVILGIFPSTVALSSGLLPLPLAPMVPFIIASNAIYITIFYYINKKSFSAGIIMASTLKFIFLMGSVTLIMNRLLEGSLVQKLSVMMSWPQLITALAGGIIAFGVLKIIKK